MIRPGDPLGHPLARAGLAASAGPLLALMVAAVAFSLTTETFFSADNLSLLLEQSVVVGILALGQTMVVLTATQRRRGSSGVPAADQQRLWSRPLERSSECPIYPGS